MVSTSIIVSPSDIPIERHPLQPFLPENALLLMLGSFPPPHNRWCMEFFYPNRSNMMWEIFGQVFYGDSQRLIDMEHKTFHKTNIEYLLRTKGIAIFDTALSVRRLQGNASDKMLEVVEKTDLNKLLQQIPQCQHIVCTGQKSAEVLCDEYSVNLPCIGCHTDFSIGDRFVSLHRMPSTSRAYPMPLSQKASYYTSLFREIGIL